MLKQALETQQQKEIIIKIHEKERLRRRHKNCKATRNFEHSATLLYLDSPISWDWGLSSLIHCTNGSGSASQNQGRNMENKIKYDLYCYDYELMGNGSSKRTNVDPQ